MSTAAARFFDDKADTWSRKYGPGGTLRTRIDEFTVSIRSRCAPGTRILDFGCGTGELASSLVEVGFKVTAADISPAMLATARARDVHARAEWIAVPPDWTVLPFADGVFGGIVSSSVLEYVDDPLRTISELTRILAEGGTLVATVPDTTTAVRRWESLLQGSATARRGIARLGPRAHRYLEYLRLSRNRLTLAGWQELGQQVGLTLRRSAAFGHFWLLEFERVSGAAMPAPEANDSQAAGFILKAKGLAERLPFSVGRRLAHAPFGFRLGPAYFEMRRDIRRFEALSDPERHALTFERLRRIVRYAHEHVPFYRDLYDARGFHPSDLRTMDDWTRVPIVTRADMQGCPIRRRSEPSRGSLLVNTGGTSGQPLEFLLDRRAFAREWAHMHHIWEAHGYRPSHLKLTFRGKHFNRAEPLRYNAVHNEFVVNSSVDLRDVVRAVEELSRSTPVRWLHGYPSLISEFAEAVASNRGSLPEVLRETLFGVLLGSEYPSPIYRDKIEAILSANVVTWYGHSEMALLARESARGTYSCLPTYGYGEALTQGSGTEPCRLICTSYHNRSHPFVRYDTGDLVEAGGGRPGALSFHVADGRTGDFVVDARGRKVALTAAIFGRHHPAFGVLRHLQVRQDGPGEVTLLVVPSAPGMSPEQVLAGFDLAGIDMTWRATILKEPVRTSSGKIKLLV